MSKIDDLHTLIRLLKEFDLPISPILEYAINEKIEKLSSDDKCPAALPIVNAPKNNDMHEASVRPRVGNGRNLSPFRQVRDNGTIMGRHLVADTSCQTITEKLNKKQVDSILRKKGEMVNGKRDAATLLPLNREGVVYTTVALNLGCGAVANCNEKLSAVTTDTVVTACCVSTGETGGKGKVFYQLNGIAVWLETRDLRDLFGVTGEKAPKKSKL